MIPLHAPCRSAAPSRGGRNRSGTGFTLMELMGVVCVIALLAGILYPVFSHARSKGRQINCLSHLYQIGMALQLYARDHDGRLPPAHNDFRPLAAPYLRSLTVLQCPDDSAASRYRELQSRSRPAAVAPAGSAPEPSGAVFSSYQYRGGLHIEDRPDIPVAGDWEFRHSDGASVLFLSGSVKWLNRMNWIPVAPGPRPLPPGIFPSRGLMPTPPLPPLGRQPLPGTSRRRGPEHTKRRP